MTKEDKIKAFEMRLDGCTFEEIGNYFGVSRQCVQQSLKYSGSVKRRNSIYPAIDKWLFENNMTWNSFAKLAFGVKYPSNTYKIRNGSQRLYLSQIKSILDFTGLTFEEAFGEVVAIAD